MQTLLATHKIASHYFKKKKKMKAPSRTQIIATPWVTDSFSHNQGGSASIKTLEGAS